ncbi:uncharacterized protein [Branchiostoma lanceolatum]|uniref:uncharacterized protein n=1 Tax=Branchiostoma lanceolatum TaxID=7740 RepID=UPI0034520D55
MAEGQDSLWLFAASLGHEKREFAVLVHFHTHRKKALRALERGRTADPPGTSERGSTDGPPGTSERGSTDGPPGTSERGSTDGPPGTSERGSTDDPPGTSERGSTDDPPGMGERGSTDGPPGTSGRGSTDDPPGTDERGSTDDPPGTSECGSTDDPPGTSECGSTDDPPGMGERGSTDGPPGTSGRGSTDGPPGTDERGSTDDPPGTSGRGSTDGPPGTDERGSTDDPLGTDERGSTDDPPGTDERGSTDDPPGTSERGSTDDPPGTSERGSTDDPLGTDERGSTDDPPGTSGRGSTDGPPGTDERGSTDDPPGTSERGSTDDPPGMGERGSTDGPPGTSERGSTDDPPGMGERGSTDGPPGMGERGSASKGWNPQTRKQKSAGPLNATCEICDKTMLKKNLSRHIREVHASSSKPNISIDRHHAGVSVDPKQGLYMISKSIRGPPYPLHTRLHIAGPTQHVQCEQAECYDITNAFSRGGVVSWQCSYLLSIPYAEATPPAVDLMDTDLDKVDMSRERKADCIALKRKAQIAGAPLVVPWKTTEAVFLSIYDGSRHHWAKLGRAVVTIIGNTVTCRCCKLRITCVHKGIAKWWSGTNSQHTTSVPLPEEESDVSDSVEQEDDMLQHMVTYLKTKTIPADFDYMACTGQELLVPCIEPKEDTCPICTENPRLHTVLTTSAARIIDLQGVTTGIKVYVRRCPQCNQTFRYQEYEDGILNYNNHTFLSMELCFWLRACVQNHVAVGRMSSILEEHLGVSLPRQDILNGYLLFEVLCQHQYDYSCVRCGHHPPILIMDLDRKVAFHMAASSLNSTENCQDEIDPTAFWDRVESEIVARGLLSRGQENPYKVEPSFDFWAPWLGPKTRGSTCYNTEFQKKRPGNRDDLQTDEADINTDLTEDRLMDLLCEGTSQTIKALCKKCKVSSDGSKVDCIRELQKKLDNPTVFNKVLAQIWGASG